MTAGSNSAIVKIPTYYAEFLRGLCYWPVAFEPKKPAPRVSEHYSTRSENCNKIFRRAIGRALRRMRKMDRYAQLVDALFGRFNSGFGDDETGDANEFGRWYGLLLRPGGHAYILTEDSQGLRDYDQYDDETEARAQFAEYAAEYGEFLEAADDDAADDETEAPAPANWRNWEADDDGSDDDGSDDVPEFVAPLPDDETDDDADADDET